MSNPQSVAPFDLRSQRSDDVLNRIERSLGVRLDLTTAVRKRRSIGCRTDRDTWVRVEARPVERLDGQGWNGAECAAMLRGVAKPEWYQGVSWYDAAHGLMWRADETQLIELRPVNPGGTLTTEPDLSGTWWTTLTTSLDALAHFPTSRVATPTMRPITQERVAAVIHSVFADVDAAIDQWTTAHGDLFLDKPYRAGMLAPGLGRLG